MAFNPIETDYRPNFGLGAYYQGINAANAKQLTEEDILKAFLANQREEQQQPLDYIIKQWDAAHAQDKLNSPAYRDATLSGYIGQAKSMSAAGRKADETVASEIPAINQENKNKFEVAKLLEQFRNSQLGQNQPTSSYEQPTPLQGDNGKMGFNFGSASNALQNPDLTSQQRQLIMQDAGKRGENVLSMFKQSGLENALVNDPEHLKAIDKIRAMGENQQNVADTRGQYLLQAALARLQKTGEKPLTLDQAVARSQRILAGQEAGDKEAALLLITNARNYKLSSQAAAWQGNNLNLPATQQTGQIQNSPSAVEQAGLLTGDSTRRNETLRNRTTSGNKFTVEKTP
ncbi:MAG: hypothetical protein IPK44_24440 [Candidatus Accumulibacter sp.]|uniref:hypothetical protein n=1 Tax=Accumulibacter sp. TaxID=2053492 RepID=UPI002589643E|nr:hypothetical protein [Accumulibacter sp.]MBK8117439.1 hypothetical protein [Accumulibacter sp.]